MFLTTARCSGRANAKPMQCSRAQITDPPIGPNEGSDSVRKSPGLSRHRAEIRQPSAEMSHTLTCIRRTMEPPSEPLTCTEWRIIRRRSPTGFLGGIGINSSRFIEP